MKKLKTLAKNSSAIRAINYASGHKVILAVDTSSITVGYILSQIGVDAKRYPSQFGSMTLSERESRYSQAKLELFGLFHALKDCWIWIIGVKNLVVEVDAKYIKGMINNPDIQPNAIINHWISAILLFNFQLCHVPGHAHGPDGLSQHPRAPEDPAIEEDYEEWIDFANSFLYENTTALTTSYTNSSYPDIPQWMVYTSTYAIEFLNKELNTSHLENTPSIHHKPAVTVYLSSTPHPNTPIPRSDRAKAKDTELKKIMEFLMNPLQRDRMEAEELKVLIRKTSGFFIADGRLWKKDSRAKHKLVINEEKQLDLLRQAHDDLGHKGVFTTRTRILERFWWPYFDDDICRYLKTCYKCQVWSTQHLYIPPMVPVLLSLFRKVYIDTMFMLKSNGYHYIIHACYSLSLYPEWHMLCYENSCTIGSFVFKDILCR